MICNAVVFATGFDAPGVDLVLIARPVFSPVRFMQMVGRGLRGPKNGQLLTPPSAGYNLLQMNRIF